MHDSPAPTALHQALRDLRQHPQRGPQLRLFAYGSLIWRPEFAFESRQPARVHGFHRALRMRSQLYRGSPEQPGLVAALVAGGSCTGLLYTVAAAEAAAVLGQVWAREMVSNVYTPRWLPCRGLDGRPLGWALAFTLCRRSPSCVPPLDEQQLRHVFQHARGRYGSTLDYVAATVQALREHGIHDRRLEQQLSLGRGLAELDFG